MKKYKKGFTILELLVVIAIIGILAAVVLAAVGSSRAKAADKAIISDLEGIRTQAELYLSTSPAKNYGSYNATNLGGGTGIANGKCPASTFSPSGPYGNSIFLDTSSNPAATYTIILNKALTDANTKSSGGVTTNRLDNSRCVSTGTSWAAAFTLKTATNKSWCVDSNGASKQVNGNAGAATGVITVSSSGVATCS